MSVVSTEEHPKVINVDTPKAGAGGQAEEEAAAGPGNVVEEEEEVFEDASDAGEVFIRRKEAPREMNELPPPAWYAQPPAPQMVSTVPHIKPEDFDGTKDWSEYQIYFDQLAELYGWDDERKAVILGICLKGEARVVLAGLEPAKRRSYFSLTNALSQSFAPHGMVHLHQAELKARKRKPDESMADLGREIAKLARLAYPTADAATREVIGINAFLEALPGPASEMKLHVIKGRPRSLQEAVAHATEVDAVMEAEARKSSRRRGDVRVLGATEEELREELEKMKVDLKKTQDELRSARNQAQKRPRKRLQDITCYECQEKGHYKRDCPKLSKEQGNGLRRLERE